MYFFLWDQIRKINPYFLFGLIVLQALGLLSLYSASHGAGGEPARFFSQQLIWIAMSWAVFLCVCHSQPRLISKALWPLFWLNILALALVFFIGKEIYNSKRWLDLGLFHYQPSETLKLILTLLIGKKLAEKPLGRALSLFDFLKLCAIALPPVFLILRQPDLGTAGLILLMAMTLILFKGVEKKALLGLTLLFAVSAPLAWKFVLKPYQKARVISFINPGKDPQGAGYSALQSKIAIGSGQIFGKGFKKGTQNKLQFLPERHTDFIFSVLSEEYGFMGSAGALILFFLMISFIFKLAGQTRNRLSCYFCLGAGAYFLWHISLNLAMTMGLFPVVGIPLPLMSYGGSHMLTAMAFLGLAGAAHKNKDLF